MGRGDVFSFGMTLLVVLALGFCLGAKGGKIVGEEDGRTSGTLETLSAVSPCDGGYAVKHFDAGTFACIDTTWVEVKP